MVAGTQGINLNPAVEGFGADSDVLMSGVDNLTIFGSNADDWISGQGGAGTGQPYSQTLGLGGGAGDDELHAGENPVRGTMMQGHAGDDLLVAGSQGDDMDGGSGNDTITGGPGRDTVQYTYAPSGVDVDLTVNGPQDTRGAGVDTITGVECMSGSAHDDVLKGNGGPNQISGNKGDDVLDGRDGQDYLDGGDGADTLRSGAGGGLLLGGEDEDTAAYDDMPGPVTLDLSIMGVAQDPTGSGAQTLEGIENAIGSPLADRLTGSAGANAIDGGAGADTIDGGAGSDRLAGGAGSDAIDSRDTSPDFVSCGEGPDSVAVDALDVVAPDCAPPAPAGGDAPGTGSGGGAPGAPVLSVVVPRQSLQAVLKRGLSVVLSCSAACRAGGRLAATRATARRLGLSRRVARRLGRLPSVELAAGAPLKVRVRLTRAAARALTDAHRVRLVLHAHAVDGSGRAAAPVGTPVGLRAR